MAKGFKDEDGKFHPIRTYKGKRKAKKSVSSTSGRKLNSGIKKKRTLQQQLVDDPLKQQELETEQRIKRIPPEFRGLISEQDVLEWEGVAGSKLVDIREEDFEGMPVTTVVFDNNDEWFEFDNARDEKRFIDENFKKQVHSGKFDHDTDLQDHLFEGDHKKFGKQVSQNLSDIDFFMESPAKALKKHNIDLDSAIRNGMIFRSHTMLKKHFENNGKLLPIEHPKIEGYTDLLNGEAFFEKRLEP